MCGFMEYDELYLQLHAFSVRAAVDANVFVGTAFLDVYARSGLIEESSCILKAVSFCVGNQSFMRRAWCVNYWRQTSPTMCKWES
ncbi:hypothetical protein NC652_020141 [Populus alba x Populus x berolinensis]|nr:hypothetical protein NC652_020141 [Populus alba x Populus x berolinensis]